MITPAYIAAHRHSIHHRAEILKSELCDCFHCLAIFTARETEDWTDWFNWIGETALCPKCDIDSVIGSPSGYPITVNFLNQLREYWFQPASSN
jgi:hypothetical protein